MKLVLFFKEKMMNNQYYGQFGGQYVSEDIKKALDELDIEYEKALKDEGFVSEFQRLLKDFVGRPTPLTFAKNLSDYYGHNIYLKREDLNHTGAHKINNSLGQILLAKRMGKKKIIAETGAGQHGVATATVAALLGLECEIYMGAVDIERQKLNVFRMELLGAKVVPVTEGLQTLSEAVTVAIRTWVSEIDKSFYCLGSAVGPYPYPKIVKEFQSVIGTEAKEQIKQYGHADIIIACVGGGSNAIGIFSGFLDDESVEIYGIEAGGKGVDTKLHAATMTKGKVGIIHGMKTIVLQEDDGEISEVYSISAGLDYPGVGPEHSYLKEIKRVKYDAITDDEAMEALRLLSKKEGIIPAIESAHALAYLEKLCPTLKGKKNIIVNVSGRGDKDMHTIFSSFNM